MQGLLKAQKMTKWESSRPAPTDSGCLQLLTEGFASDSSAQESEVGVVLPQIPFFLFQIVNLHPLLLLIGNLVFC